jgi:hypothetical protein
MSKWTVDVEYVVEVEIHDPDVIDRCFTEDWQAHYWPVTEREEVVRHIAFNAAMNGIESISRLDGWADLPDTAATIEVDRTAWYSHATEHNPGNEVTP